MLVPDSFLRTASTNPSQIAGNTNNSDLGEDSVDIFHARMESYDRSSKANRKTAADVTRLGGKIRESGDPLAGATSRANVSIMTRQLSNSPFQSKETCELEDWPFPRQNLPFDETNTES